ncbi:hypothetical protein D3C78_1934920 [compost metagenome]
MATFKKGAHFLEVFGHQTAFFFNQTDFCSVICGDNNLSPGAYSRHSTGYCSGNPS